MRGEPLGEFGMSGYTVVGLPFSAGADTKTDPKMLDSPKLTLLQDAIFTNIKRISKRNGYDISTTALVGGGTWSNPTMVKSYRNEITLAASTSNGPRLLSYSPTLGAWSDRGKYSSIAISKQMIDSPEFANPSGVINTLWGTANSSAVVNDNISLFAYDTSGGSYGFNSASGTYGGSYSSYITVIDNQTGIHLADSLLIPNALGFSKAAILGASTFAVFYISSTSSNLLCVRIITVTQGGGVVLGSEVSIGVCAAKSDLTQQFPYCYDFINTASGATVVVANEPDVKTYNINTSGATTASASITSSGDITPVMVSLDSSLNVWVYWGSAGASLYYAVYSPTLTVILAATLIITLIPVDSEQPFLVQLASLNVGAGQTIYYSSYLPGDGTGTFYLSVINQYSLTIGGGVSGAAFLQAGIDIYGRIFTCNGRNYIPCVSLSGEGQSTGVVIDLADGSEISKFLPTEAEGVYSPEYVIGGSTTNAALIGVRYPGFINTPQSLSATEFFLAAGIVVNTEPLVLTPTSNEDWTPVVLITTVGLGVCGITFDFNNIDAYQALIQQDTLLMNGGLVSMYDGANVSELGFTIDPSFLHLQPGTSGGNIPSGTFIYFVTYEWVDANGNLYESAPSTGLSVIFTTGSSNKVIITVKRLNVTLKNNILIKLWRSDSNQGGKLAYLIGTISNPQEGGVNYEFTTFVDEFSSAAVLNSPTLYTQGGAILPNIAPPPMMVMWTNNNRAWGVDSENPETTIEYCKTSSQGTGVSFSTGLLEILVDSAGGAITFGQGMDEKTVILKQNAPNYYFVGDGANDAGTGATNSVPQRVPCDAGCSNSKSGVLFPGGILFRSTDNKGIYIFTRGVQVEYFGLDVEAYNNQDIQSATLVPNRNQIRFLTSNGFSLLYDYIMKQWSVFTNHAGLSADTFNGLYVYLRSSNNFQDGLSVYEENESSFLDNVTPYAPLLQMSWIRAQNIQGFNRIRRIELLGDYTNGSISGHGVQISAAYDFIPSFGAPIPYYFDGSKPIYQYRERLPRQKCDAVQLQIQEIVTGASGEFIDFSDLGIEILPKTGLNKLPASRSVG